MFGNLATLGWYNPFPKLACLSNSSFSYLQKTFRFLYGEAFCQEYDPFKTEHRSISGSFLPIVNDLLPCVNLASASILIKIRFLESFTSDKTIVGYDQH